jgi:hypothetical protein
MLASMQHVEAGDFRHVDIEKDDVGSFALNEANRRGAATALLDDRHVRLPLEIPTQLAT